MSLLLYGLMSRSAASVAAAAGAASARSKAAESFADMATRRLKVLEERVETLALLALALAEALKKRTGADDAEILDLVKVLDLRDGTADGKLTAAARKCAQCVRVLASHHPRCIYCGGESLSDVPPGSIESLLR